ncbi:hypothetical protein [Hyunsoonleella ulvae]|uniref:hypothetical protein n=1 Tax=Hyunsoonleella ulvae TaxID=2799948 RepID=UPI0019395ACD|nr:hypothetical protein [Hyunsoonleella ulvae]
MSKVKIILILILCVILIGVADNIFSKDEYQRGVIIKKGYINKITYTASGNNSRTGHTVIKTPTYDPNGYLFYIQDKSNNEIIIRTNYDIYKTSHEGDSVKYRLSKGCFSKAILESAIVELMPNVENRKRFSDKNLTAIERILRNSKQSK